MDYIKKEFSFYEFAGIITPSVILLYFLNWIINDIYSKPLFGFSTVGSAIVFIIIAYGVGQLLHGISSLFEKMVWGVFGGMPTQWLTKPPRFGKHLFDEIESGQILEKLHEEFGEVEGKDYGPQAYAKILSVGKSERIDVFNANYSLFRGLCIAFLILGFVMVYYRYDWLTIVMLFVFLILSIGGMIRYGRYYAVYIFRLFMQN